MGVTFAPLAFSFMLLTALLYSALIMGAVWANNRVNRNAQSDAQWSVRLLRFFVGGYILCIGLLAVDRVFLNETSVPPKMLLGMIPAFAGVLLLAFHPRILKWIREIPQRWLIGLQSFRVIVEVQLFFLAQTGFISKLLTFQGRNFDIVVGLTAPLAAWYVHRKHKQNQGAPKFVVAWNVIGLVLLTNVVAHAVLSFPTFGIIQDPPGSQGLAAFPYIWLPTFMVPFAFLLHILSLKREWSFYKHPAYKRTGEIEG